MATFVHRHDELAALARWWRSDSPAMSPMTSWRSPPRTSWLPCRTTRRKPSVSAQASDEVCGRDGDRERPLRLPCLLARGAPDLDIAAVHQIQRV